MLASLVGIKAQTITNSSFLSDVTISASSNTTSGGVQHSGTVVADFDGDGKIDVARVSSTNAQVFPNIHTGVTISASSFDPAISLTTSSSPANIYTSDIDGDGKMDIVVSASNNIDVFFNTSTSGSISFSAKQTIVAPNSIARLVFADYTGDGKDEIAGVAQYGSTTITLLPNTSTSGTLSVGTSSVLPIGSTVYDFVFVDIDLDGDNDIFGIFTGTAYFVPNSSGSFGSVQTQSYVIAAGSYSGRHSLGFADLNNDNKLDIFATQANTLFVFTNNTSGAFSFSNLTFNSYSFSGSGFALNVIASDFNGDGKKEILIPNSNSGSNICFTNTSTTGGNITFSSPNYLDSYTIQTIRSADIDNDGKNDIIQHTYYSTNFKVRQNYVVTSAVAATPTSLSGFTACFGSTSTSQTTSVSGTQLTADMVLTAPTVYEISTDGTTYSTSVTLAQSGGTVAATTIYVRMSASAAVGTPSGNLNIASTGATTENVALSGTVNALPTVTITDPAAACTPSTVDITAASVTSGSTAGLTYTYWTDNAATTALASPSAVNATGTYYVLGTTAAGCTDIQPVSVTINDPITAVTIAVNEQPCGSTATGSADVTLTGGIATNYAWTRNGTAYNALPANAPTNLLSGTYVVTVTDACGNTLASNSISLSNVAALTLSNVSQTATIVCNGATTGEITGTITGGGTAPRVLTVTNQTTNQSYSQQVPSSGAPATGYVYIVGNLPAGTYTVVASSTLSSCTSTGPNVTITEPTAIIPVGTATAACFGLSNGSITASASGGTAPYTYSIDGTTFQSTTSFTSLAAGAYTLTVKDANDCEVTASVTVTSPSTALSVSASAQTNVACLGQSTGSVTLVGAGGTGTYTYSIDGTNFQASATFGSLAAGSYTFTIKDQSNCTATVDVTLTEPASALAATTSVVDLLCFGVSTGQASVTASGGTIPYTYLWSGSQTTASITGQTAGTYSVTVTDANSCSTTVSATIATAPAITLTTTGTDLTCNGVSDGTVTALGGGWVAPYTYSWDSNPIQNTATATGLPAGTYTVTLTDNNNCVRTQTITINEPAALAVSIGSPTNVLCNGSATGSVTATATGGTVASSYSYLWDDASAQNTATASNLLAGTYTVTVEDDNGCQSTASATITKPASAVDLVSSAIVNVNCFGGSTGGFVVTATGGTSPYDISMTAPVTSTITAATQTYSNLAANAYEVSVQDANGCIDTVIVNITQGTQVTYTTVVTDACNPNNDGSITFTASGGTAPYQYSIDNGTTWSSTDAFTGLAAGTYNILVEDSYNCTTAANTNTINTAASPLAVSIVETTTATCYQVDDAVLTSTVTGGQSTYTYLWSDNSTSAHISAGVQGTTYSVTVTDSYGCTATSNAVTTTTISDMVPTTTVSNVTCNGASDGSIDITTIAGGNGSYNYSWDGISYSAFTAGSTVTNGTLAAGSYTLYIQDQTNTSCISQTTISVTEPEILSGTVTAIDASCNGANNGSITITNPAGGSGSYEYSIDGGTTWQSNATFTGLSTGTYDVQIRDANVVGCIVDLDGATNTAISEPTALSASISAQTNSLCNGDSNGSATVTVTGGSSPYSYSWTSGGTAATETGLAAGSYTVTSTDANGCTTTASVTITEPTLLEVVDDGISDASCANTTDGAIPITAFGGTAPYTYSWSGPNGFTSTLEDQLYTLSPGTYSVTVTDAAGCTAVGSNLVVGSPSAVILSLVSTNETCFGSADGTITTTISGGTAPYSFQWTQDGVNYATAQDLTGLVSGDYQVTATDANLCTFSSSVETISSPIQIIATVAADATAICSGQTASFTISGTATDVVTYSINSGSNATATIGAGGSVSITVLNTTVLQTLTLVSVANATCSNTLTGTATININALPIANAGTDQTVCDGASVTLNAVSTNTITWNNSVVNNTPFTVSNNANAPVTTTYTLTETDVNGCVGTDQVDVIVNPTPTVDAIADQALCGSTQTTAVTFVSAFGVAGTTYTWTNSEPTIGLAASGTGDIAAFTAVNNTTSAIVATITVTPQANGCDGTPETFTITVQPTPSVDQQADITYCGGVQQPPIVFTGTPNTQYNWTSSQNVGFFSSGIATPSIGTYFISPTVQVVSTVVVTPEIFVGGATCTGAPMTFIVTVNPTPTVNSVSDQALCNGSSTTALTFTGAVAGASYNWTNSDASTGLAASGTGDINSFVAINTGNAELTSTITITPSLNGCTGTATTATITVYPTPSVTSIADQTICAGSSASEVNISGTVSGTLYSWSNSNTNIGLGASGFGSVPAFNATNAGVTPLTATVTVTPTFIPTAGTTFGTVTEGNTLTLSAPAGLVFTSVSFASYGDPSGTGPNYVTGTNNAANTLSLIEQTALGQNSFTIAATDANFPNTFGGTQTLAVTLTYGDPTLGCQGNATTFDYIINPTPVFSDATATICSGATASVAPSGVPSGALFTWTVSDNPNVTGDADNTSTAASFSATLLNTTNTAQSVVYTVTPQYTNNGVQCDGATFTITVTVDPTPSVVDQTETICSNATFTVTPVNGSGNIVPSNTTYSWNAPSVTGITGTTAGTSASNISGTLVNTTNAPIDVVYTVTPTSGTCNGQSFTVTVTVNPMPMIANATTTTCSGSVVNYTPINGTDVVPSNTTYSWSFVDVTNLSGETIGSNQTTFSQTLINTGILTEQVVYTITPTSGLCVGSSFTYTVNVDPVPSISNTTAVICSGNAFTVSPVNGTDIVPSGTQYTWTASSNSNITGAANESTPQNSISQTLSNISNSIQSLTYTVTPVLPGCNGATFDVVVTINPAPIVSNESINACSGTAFTFEAIDGVNGNSAPVGTTYTWTVQDNAFVLGEANVSTAQSSVSQTLVNNTGSSQIVSYTVTPYIGACPGNAFTLDVSVGSTVTVAAINGATNICTGSTTQLASATTGGVWTSSDATVATISTTGVVTGLTAGTATMTYTVTDANGCSASVSATINVNAGTTATITASGATTFCAGGSVTLTANAGSTYLWSNGAQTQSITVDVDGSYYVTVTNASGCSATSAAEAVTVNALPTATIASTGSNVCLGSTVTLTASGGIGYVWSNNATTASINVVATNTYSVTVTDANGCENSASEVVTFNANPAVTISANGPTVFCQGGSLTLTATGGSNYVWSNGDQGASTTVSQSGAYYVIVTNASGCSTQSAIVNVTVNALPVVAPITGSNAVCEGGNITLSSATIGGVWTSANNFIATIDGAGNVTGLNAGSTTMAYTVTNNGCTASTVAQVNVLNNPIMPTITPSGATSVCPGGSVVLFASNAANYQWSTGATTPFIIVDQSGDYTVTATGLNGCSTTSLPLTIFIGDDIAPVITAPLDVTVTPNLGCEAIGVSLGTPVTSDNCTVMSVSNDAPAIYPIGITTVTWTVIDASGNTSTATQLVNVFDQSAPTAQAPANVTVSSNDFCEATGVDLGMPFATDNCTNNLVITNNAPATYPLGTTVVTWTITDAAGNTTSVDQTVTVVDETAPVVLLANTSVILDSEGNAIISFEDIDNGSFDNCGIVGAVLSQSSFDCSNVGNNLISVTITDNSGNQSTAQVMVTVVASDACGDANFAGPSVPDAFTPNGNNFNDTWVIPGLEGYNTKEMTVYSRYGTLVHYSSQYNNDWDGTLLNTGTPVPDGTYYYILNLDGDKQLNGYVYINRVKQ